MDSRRYIGGMTNPLKVYKNSRTSQDELELKVFQVILYSFFSIRHLPGTSIPRWLLTLLLFLNQHPSSVHVNYIQSGNDSFAVRAGNSFDLDDNLIDCCA